MQFGDKLIIDCSYDQHMNVKQLKSNARQLMHCFTENRKSRQPFDLHFCNVNFNGDTFTNLQRLIPGLRSPSFPTNLHERCFSDVFPQEKLVFLTPHCHDELTEYDPEAIYIIGAIVGCHEPLSMAKAKGLNIKMARLPLDRYLHWGPGARKDLTVDQVMKIMLTLKNTNHWETALTHVPQRKIVNTEFDQRKAVTKWNENVNKFTID